MSEVNRPVLALACVLCFTAYFVYFVDAGVGVRGAPGYRTALMFLTGFAYCGLGVGIYGILERSRRGVDDVGDNVTASDDVPAQHRLPHTVVVCDTEVAGATPAPTSTRSPRSRRSAAGPRS